MFVTVFCGGPLLVEAPGQLPSSPLKSGPDKLSCRLSEADGCADGSTDWPSTVGLSETPAASEVDLEEREVLLGHDDLARRTRLQGTKQAATEGKVAVEPLGGRFVVVRVDEESHLGVGGPVAVPEQHLDPVHLQTSRVNFLKIKQYNKLK